MKVRKVGEIINAEVLTGNDRLDEEIEDCAASDLMSDVLSRNTKMDLLISGLSNIQLIRTASLFGIKAVVLVRGKNIDKSIITLAKREKIIFMVTRFSCFETCGRLYQKGLRNKADQNRG